MTPIESVLTALEQAQVRYLLVGGVAVVLHGYLRTTADLDLILALDEDNVARAATAFAGLGYRPRVPVQLTDLADPRRRQEWITTKGLTVLSLWSPEQPALEVDVFVEEPLDFAAAHARAVRADLGACQASVVSLDDLLALKRRAGRPRDLEDIDALERLSGRDDP